MPQDLGVESQDLLLGGINGFRGAVRIILGPSAPTHPLLRFGGRISKGISLGESQVRLGRVHADLVEMLVQGSALQLRQIESDGRHLVRDLTEQVMATQMVLGERDQVCRGLCLDAGKQLGMDVAADMLDANLVVSCLGRLE